LTEHPSELDWFVKLLGQHGCNLGSCRFLPDLARPQRAVAIEALSAHGLTPWQVFLMLLASNDSEKRFLGYRRLKVMLKAGEHLPLINTWYLDDAPFTARVVLGRLLAECEDPETVCLALPALQY
jgi:hypothetical protein